MLSVVRLEDPECSHLPATEEHQSSPEDSEPCLDPLVDGAKIFDPDRRLVFDDAG